MVEKSTSVLVIGFNTRPLACSLSNAGYEVHAVDFFGDEDLFSSVKDSIIVIKKLGSNYKLIKDGYGPFLVDFALDMIDRHPNINILIIGSGLDDNFEGREKILAEIERKGLSIMNANNDIDILKSSRNITHVFKLMEQLGYEVPITRPYTELKHVRNTLEFPFILKKKQGSGGINVHKINNLSDLSFFEKLQEVKGFNKSDWIMQDFIEGTAVSCTIISNGKDAKVVSINKQIIGFKDVNPPHEFIYCGNIVPAYLLEEDNRFISEIALGLAKKLGLKGINGFDFVLRNHYPYLMEINPRIPGSIRASESVLELNLLDLHIQSFFPENWNQIETILNNAKPSSFSTKLVVFASRDLSREILVKINSLEYIHDKTDPSNVVSKGDPLCTILFDGNNFSESYFGALKILNTIKKLMN